MRKFSPVLKTKFYVLHYKILISFPILLLRSMFIHPENPSNLFNGKKFFFPELILLEIEISCRFRSNFFFSFLSLPFFVVYAKSSLRSSYSIISEGERNVVALVRMTFFVYIKLRIPHLAQSGRERYGKKKF